MRENRNVKQNQQRKKIKFKFHLIHFVRVVFCAFVRTFPFRREFWFFFLHLCAILSFCVVFNYVIRVLSVLIKNETRKKTFFFVFICICSIRKFPAMVESRDTRAVTLRNKIRAPKQSSKSIFSSRNGLRKIFFVFEYRYELSTRFRNDLRMSFGLAPWQSKTITVCLKERWWFSKFKQLAAQKQKQKHTQRNSQSIFFFLSFPFVVISVDLVRSDIYLNRLMMMMMCARMGISLNEYRFSVFFFLLFSFIFLYFFLFLFICCWFLQPILFSIYLFFFLSKLSHELRCSICRQFDAFYIWNTWNMQKQNYFFLKRFLNGFGTWWHATTRIYRLEFVSFTVCFQLAILIDRTWPFQCQSRIIIILNWQLMEFWQENHFFGISRFFFRFFPSVAASSSSNEKKLCFIDNWLKLWKIEMRLNARK